MGVRISPTPHTASAPATAETTLPRGLAWSFGLHVLAVVLMILQSLIFPGGTPKILPPTLRVDLVGLPTVLKKDLKPTATSPNAQDSIQKALKDAEESALRLSKRPPTEVAKPGEMVLKPKHAPEKSKPEAKTESRLHSALARAKALARVSEASAPLKRAGTSGQPIYGNQVSKGTALSGDAREAAEAGYFDLVRDRLVENWSLPVWLARQKLSAQIQLKLDSRGRILAYQFRKSSGNPSFDEAVVRALKTSEPFPRPPQEIQASLGVDGILVGFPL